MSRREGLASRRTLGGASFAVLAALLTLTVHRSTPSSPVARDVVGALRTPSLPTSSVRTTSTCYPAGQATALRHHVRRTPAGLITEWTLTTRPETAAGCEVVLTVDGAEADAPGHFRLPSGSGLFVGPATLVDARGTRTHLEPALTRAGTAYRLSAALLGASAFPAVLDPSLSFEVEASVPVNAPFGRTGKLASDGTHWLAAAEGSNGSELALLDADARPLEQVPGPRSIDDALFTDQFVLVTRDAVQRGHSLSELTDGGRITFPVVGSNRLLAVGSSTTLLVMRTLPLGDGGDGLEFERIESDFSWDGGGVQWPTAFTPAEAAALEGATVYVSYFTRALETRVLTTTATGLPQADLLLRDGGALLQRARFATDGVGTTLVLWKEYASGPPSLRGLIAHAGVASTDPFTLATGLADREVMGAWDGTAFRVVYSSTSPDGLAEVRVLADGGLAGAPTRLFALDGGLPGVLDLSAGATRTLLAWSSSTVNGLAARVVPLQNGASTAIDGGAPLFFQPNTARSPAVASRGTDLLAAWVDDRAGSDVQQVWVRRFTSNLVAVDPDAHPIDSTPGLSNAGPALIVGPQKLCATDTGYAAVFDRSTHWLVVRLDAAGLPTAPPVDLNPTGTSILGPALFCSGNNVLVKWFNPFPADTRYALFFPDGGLSPPQGLGLISVTHAVPLGADFAMFTSTGVRRVDTPGTSSALPVGPFPQGALAVASDGVRLLVVKQPVAWPAALVAQVCRADGGAEPEETIYNSLGSIEAQAAWDGRRFYLAMSESTDAGVRLLTAWRGDDGGWTAAPEAAQASEYSFLAVTAVADAGMALAYNSDDLRRIYLKRVLWLDDGAPCGAATECLSGFCVDGVCCDSACGGGAVDCLACSVAKGATTDGVCRPLPTSAVCRPALSNCDRPETCDGVTLACPPDAVADAGLVCRPASSSCDLEERCDGTAGTCPPDVTLPDATPCDGGVCGGGVCGGPAAPTVTIAPPPTATCETSQTVFFTVKPDGPHSVELQSSIPSVVLDADAGTFHWTPSARARGGEVQLRADGTAVDRVTLSSDCAPTSLAVGCGCGSAHGAGWVALALALASGRRRRPC